MKYLNKKKNVCPPHPPESAIDNEELTSELAYGWMVQHKKKKKDRYFELEDKALWSGA